MTGRVDRKFQGLGVVLNLSPALVPLSHREGAGESGLPGYRMWEANPMVK